jgi:hypothetical protein
MVSILSINVSGLNYNNSGSNMSFFDASNEGWEISTVKRAG